MAGEPESKQGDDAGGTVGQDAGDDVSREHATWRDLVARLELPQYVDPATAPWPARENLGNRPPGQAVPGGGPGQTADQDPLKAGTDRPEPTGGTGSGPGGTSAGSRSGRGSGTDRSRVIRPASCTPFAAESAAATSPLSGANALTPDNRREPADQPGAAEADYPDYETDADYETGGDFETGLDFLSYSDDEGPEDRYIPPPVPALPQLDPVARGAWTALFGGPGYLFVATLLSWQVPGWAELAAIVAFVAGFTILVVRLGDGPSRRDGPDQGAVV